MPKICLADDGWNVGIEVDLFSPGTQEDGVPYEAELYKIQARNAVGNIFTLNFFFLTSEKVEGDDPEFGYYIGFTDKRKEMKEKAENLLKKIEAKGIIDTDHWIESEPAYGSEAYCAKYGF